MRLLLVLALVVLASGCVTAEQIKYCKSLESDFSEAGTPCDCKAAISNPSNLNENTSATLKPDCRCDCMVNGTERTVVFTRPKAG